MPTSLPSSAHKLVQYLSNPENWDKNLNKAKRKDRLRIEETVEEFISSHSEYEKSNYWRETATECNDTPVGMILSSLMIFLVFLREKTQDPRTFLSRYSRLYYEELRRRFPNLGFCSCPKKGLKETRFSSSQFRNTVITTADNCCAIDGKGSRRVNPLYSSDLVRCGAASAPTARGYRLLALIYCMKESGKRSKSFLSSPAFEPNIALDAKGLPKVSTQAAKSEGINGVYLPHRGDAGRWNIPYISRRCETKY